ncbi:MAG: glycosyltransferase, partial [Rhodothermales bacterium]|nr:glycosyltransferase [Rhodothermales bacterium]
MLSVVPILYAASMLVLLAYGANMLWLSARYRDIDVEKDGPVPDPDKLPPLRGLWPAVTVQLPIFNEAYVVERLIDACAQLDYPRHCLEIQILDDSTDETVELAAERAAYWSRRGVNIVHIRRKNRTGYKAGALANGLQAATGDFIAVFDADFLPEPDYLRRIIPAFDGADVGMVQARWGHLNRIDSLLTKIQAFGLDTHFALEHRVREALGCFINFNGTAGVWRRECIEDAGGWSSDTLTEDLDLSYRAQMRGWRFRYLEDVEVAAELPNDMNAFR